MRVSVNPWDSGYEHFHLREKVTVYLDGVKQLMCVTADEEEGYVVRYVCKSGNLSIEGSGGMVEQEVVRGEVVIAIQDENP